METLQEQHANKFKLREKEAQLEITKLQQEADIANISSLMQAAIN